MYQDADSKLLVFALRTFLIRIETWQRGSCSCWLPGFQRKRVRQASSTLYTFEDINVCLEKGADELDIRNEITLVGKSASLQQRVQQV